MRTIALLMFGFMEVSLLGCSGTGQGGEDAKVADSLELLWDVLTEEIGIPPGAVQAHADYATRCLEPSAGSEPGIVLAYEAADPAEVRIWLVDELESRGWRILSENSARVTLTRALPDDVIGEVFVDQTTDLGDIWVAGSIDRKACT